MKLRILGTILVLASLALACSRGASSTTAVDSPDSWVAADATSAAGSATTAVLGYESPPAAQLEPAPSPDWEITEGHLTLVSYFETP